MIKRVLKPPKSNFGGVAFLRISALYKTYGERTELYVQECDGVVKALFAGYQSGFSLCADKTADFSELDEFFTFLGAEVFCEGEIANRLKPYKKTQVFIMRLEACSELVGANHSRISEVYEALSFGADGDIELPEFDMWYTDFCLRFNHGVAEYSILENSVAVCGFMTETASLITGVAVKPSKRGKGEGKRAVVSLITAIKEKYKNSEIYAAASLPKIPFYEKCGFVFEENCAVLKY